MLKPNLVAFGDLKPTDCFIYLEGEPNETWMKIIENKTEFNVAYAVSLNTGKLMFFCYDSIVRRSKGFTLC